MLYIQDLLNQGKSGSDATIFQWKDTLNQLMAIMSVASLIAEPYTLLLNMLVESLMCQAAVKAGKF